jgi:hypothetical protein
MACSGSVASTVSAGPAVVAGGCRLTVALPLTLVSPTDVAVTVTVAGAGYGVMYSPELPIDPMLPVHPDGPLTAHVTEWLYAPVPLTFAVNCCVVPMVAVEGVTVTPVIVGAAAVTVTCALPYLVKSSVEVAVIVAVPALAGVNNPVFEIAPMPEGPTVHVTVLLYAPTPCTVAVACAVCEVLMELGATLTVTLVIAATGFTVTCALPDFVVSSVEVAVMVAVPAIAGVNSPMPEMLPIVDGLTDHVTPLEYAPVPATVAVPCDVCAVVIDVALIVTETLVIVGGGAVTVTCALPDFVVSSVEVAVIVAVPVPAGVNTPALETVPPAVPLTDHVTPLEYEPVPATVAVACVVCAVVIVDGFSVTVTDVMVGAAAPTVTVALPDFVGSSTEVAVIVAIPVVAAVNNPVLDIVPMLDGLTDHVTSPLKDPVPDTSTLAWAVCPVVIDAGLTVTVTAVTEPPPPVQLPHAPHPATSSAHTTAPTTLPVQRIVRIAFRPSVAHLRFLRNCTRSPGRFLCPHARSYLGAKGPSLCAGGPFAENSSNLRRRAPPHNALVLLHLPCSRRTP